MEEFNSTLSAKFFRVHRLLVHGEHALRGGCRRMAYGGQGRVLKLLKLKPEMGQREMAEILGIRPQSLGETLTKLEAAGYVEREPMEGDRRAMLVRLTEAGAQAAEDGGDNGDALFDSLSDEEKAQLEAILDKLAAVLESELPPPPPGPEHCRRDGPGPHGPGHCRHGEGRGPHHGEYGPHGGHGPHGHGCCREEEY